MTAIPQLPTEALDLIKAGVPLELIVLTREQVAAILQCHPTSVGKIAARGRLREFRTGPQDGTPRFTVADLLAYINEQRAAQRPVVQRLPANHHAMRAKLRPVPDAGANEPWDE